MRAPITALKRSRRAPQRQSPGLEGRRLMTTTHRERSAIGAMYAGLGLTIVAMVVPYIDHATANVLADHIRAGYPTYSQARVDSTVTT